MSGKVIIAGGMPDYVKTGPIPKRLGWHGLEFGEHWPAGRNTPTPTRGFGEAVLLMLLVEYIPDAMCNALRKRAAEAGIKCISTTRHWPKMREQLIRAGFPSQAPETTLEHDPDDTVVPPAVPPVNTEELIADATRMYAWLGRNPGVGTRSLYAMAVMSKARAVAARQLLVDGGHIVSYPSGLRDAWYCVEEKPYPQPPVNEPEPEIQNQVQEQTMAANTKNAPQYQPPVEGTMKTATTGVLKSVIAPVPVTVKDREPEDDLKAAIKMVQEALVRCQLIESVGEITRNGAKLKRRVFQVVEEDVA